MFVVFLWMGTVIPFPHPDWKAPVSKNCLKIMANDLKIAEPQLFNIRMLILS